MASAAEVEITIPVPGGSQTIYIDDLVRLDDEYKTITVTIALPAWRSLRDFVFDPDARPGDLEHELVERLDLAEHNGKIEPDLLLIEAAMLAGEKIAGADLLMRSSCLGVE